MYFHVKLLTTATAGEAMIDLTEDELITRFVEPYLEGETIVINGTTMDPRKLYRVVITSTETTLDSIIQKIKRRDEESNSPYSLFKSSAKWRAIDEATNITDKYIV